ncbi:MAG: response regulator transcription factor [Propionibacteriaceae bacterium]|nr:response regulator transcription factor [Propionibacteriaceae bacterium]
MKLLVVDDNSIIRETLAKKLLLFNGVRAVDRAADGAEALRMMERKHYDLVFLDIDMPGQDGISVLEQIQDVPVVMLTSYNEPKLVRLALAKGARGYLTYGNFSERDLLAALLLASRGGLVLGPGLSVEIPALSEDIVNLTPAERRILNLLSQGYTNEQLGARLSVSPLTVKTHLQNIYKKLGVHSRAEAVGRWLTQVSPAEPTEGQSSPARHPAS